MGKRLAYLLPGYGIAAVIMLVLWVFTGKFSALSLCLLGNAFGLTFVFWAERKGKVKTIEELNRPLTLFPRDRA